TGRTDVVASAEGGHLKQGRKVAQAVEMSAFSRNVARILEAVEYRRCENGEDLEDIYRLRYKSYHSAGLIRSNSERKIADEHDESETAYCFGVYYEGKLISTIRLHHVTAE